MKSMLKAEMQNSKLEAKKNVAKKCVTYLH